MLTQAATATTLTAPETTPVIGSLTGLLLVAAAVTLGYAFTCWIWPFKPCRRCTGSGKLRAPFNTRALRIHPRCGGTGLRLRTGRRLYEYLRTEHRNAHHGRTTTR